ncbi:MAG: type II toxin-antitoxin system VapC family toxin [Pseudomonadales bacterium]
MRGIDTNVLVRYLVQDDPKQSKKASKFIDEYCTLDAPCFIGHIVLCELVWVLESNYGQTRNEITLIIEHLLQVGELEVMDQEVVWKALNDYKTSNVDFPDHLIGRVNESRGCEFTVTFDKKAAKQPLFEEI